MKALQICSALAALLIAGCATAPSDEAPFIIQAHRGAGKARPENTLESFEWSWGHKGITPEADLRVTKDGTIVTFHDKNFKRIAPQVDKSIRSKKIEDLTWDQIKDIDVGSFRGEQFKGEHIPLLEDVFKVMQKHPEHLVFLDIKEMKTKDYPRLAKVIKKYGLTRQCIFTTSHYDLIRQWNKIEPDSPTMLWVSTHKDPAKENAKLAEVRAENFAGLTFLQIHVHPKDGAFDANSPEPFKYPNMAFLKTIRAELAEHGVNFQMLPWNSQDSAIFDYLLEFGTRSFATDYPEVTFNAVQEFQNKKGGE